MIWQHHYFTKVVITNHIFLIYTVMLLLSPPRMASQSRETMTHNAFKRGQQAPPPELFVDDSRHWDG